MSPIWRIREGEGPLVAAAIHNGHDVRDDVLEHLAVTEAERLREEDPYTSEWTSVADTRIVGLRSRFEVDLNRPPDQAVYRKPADAWGLEIWNSEPPLEVIERSRKEYEAFYETVQRLLKRKERNGPFVVFDLHSYNHRRGGPGHPAEDPELNPEVNVGTGAMDRKRWALVVDQFVDVLRSADFRGRHLDVRENVKFRGGHFPRWIHTNFPESGCALAIEIKKFFMDEWSGEADHDCLAAIRDVLEETVVPVTAALKEVS